MVRLSLAVALLLALAQNAHADGRLVHAFDADSEIQSTGNGFAWTTADGHIRVTDARGRTLQDVRPSAGCRTPGATMGVVLIVCGPVSDLGFAQTWLLDAHTGVMTSRSVLGEPGRIGQFWIESLYDPDGTPHAESQVYTNWRTGEQRRRGNPSDQPVLDLDDPDLGVRRLPYRVRGGRIFVRRGDDWRPVARCAAACGDILVWRRRLAYVDPVRGLLIERRPRHRRRWRVPGALRHAPLHHARNALVLQSGTQVWRAERR